MSNTVIKVENLSKYYRLGSIGGGTLREDVNRWMAALQGKPDPLLKIGQTDNGSRKGDQVWALRDVSFEVKEGEILGIIGPNGAGKSTLLKILSRITAPTEGRIIISGRIGSLLEVGTGFHPELTGRENIYLNGTILGMKKFEVDRKLAEIIEFAEMSKFVDTPVKRYSSGMTVRLAFAVAAHLEPEILIIDEVLAVGDYAFQKKCIGKMGEVSRAGRTVLFVSHNMGMVESLCTRAILLEKGALAASGDTHEIVELYSREVLPNNSAKKENYPCSSKRAVLSVEDFSAELQARDSSSDLVLKVVVKSGENHSRIGFGLAIRSSIGATVAYLNPKLTGISLKLKAGQCVSETFSISNIDRLLNGGDYIVSMWLEHVGTELLLRIEDAAAFNLPLVDVHNTGELADNRIHGILPLKMLRAEQVGDSS